MTSPVMSPSSAPLKCVAAPAVEGITPTSGVGLEGEIVEGLTGVGLGVGIFRGLRCRVRGRDLQGAQVQG